jgi:hypothetical protein
VTKISVIVTGDKVWRKKLLFLSKNIGKVAVRPAFESLNKKMMNTLNKLFAPSSGGRDKGRTHAHGYTGAYRSGLKSIVTDNSLVIMETVEDGGRHIREGVKPNPQIGPHGLIIPGAVVRWALVKLGVDQSEAFAIGQSIVRRGIGWPGGDSPIPHEMPMGERRFSYPAWVVTDQHKKDIEDLAAKIGGLAVTYLER